ncbi:alpha-methylacyl-CoA racemase [Microbacterium resistens]|uniref:Alpha-methylacyl-CoA racemase n=1 Tax=Microbacterium resistens TaxID=156977 RepID=A0ABU1SHB7_9MICO|nr:CaiB/BaiF CoA-transferase family protein [Microbacterium resistens]MDR6868358.1 alpha-methylacyl-CoA racemase [Microbacterium resistens]
MSGPLAGVTIVELGGIGPAPFAGMMLGDLGADVIRIDRVEGLPDGEAATHTILLRGRRSVGVDLKDPRGRDLALSLIARADGVIEGFRPGVAERLGLGPEIALARNPALVYGRMTGWGQEGPLSQTAGHDINYIAVSGALEPIAGGDGAPAAPLNMLGDFGGGAMLLVTGMLAALLSARGGGAGQVVDAAIVDGAALMTAMHRSMLHSGLWDAPRGGNLFDGGAPYYGVYRTADRRWMAVGAIEPKFYAELLRGLDLAHEVDAARQTDPLSWPETRSRFATRFAERTRAQWEERFHGLDACTTPVIAPDEVMDNAHLSIRGTYSREDGLVQPSPAPRFSRTRTTPPTASPSPGEHTHEVLAELGLDAHAVETLIDARVVRASTPAGQIPPSRGSR